MRRVESHTPSTINWVDFVSTDLDAAAGGQVPMAACWR